MFIDNKRSTKKVQFEGIVGVKYYSGPATSETPVITQEQYCKLNFESAVSWYIGTMGMGK